MSKDYYSYTKKSFGKWAPIYDIWTAVIPGVRQKVVGLITPKKGLNILDVCTGTGSQAFAFGKKGYDVVGIDLSGDMLKVANKKNKYDNVKFMITDAIEMPFDNNQFDVSVISFALHEMPLDIRKKVLAEMIRVTKPKGDVIIVDYSLPKNRIKKYLIYHFVKLYESKYYTEFIKSDIKKLIKDYGIEMEREISVIFGGAKIFKGVNEKPS
ncbi:MAG: class I SAM-dependent methyltransferase [Patescibacteria group bacterium]